MSAIITKYGVQAPSQLEILQELQDDMRAIYGENIELESNTPDGQAIGNEMQRISDQNEVIKNLFASLFPSTAQGVFFDYNVDLIGMQRKVGFPTRVTMNIAFDGTQSISAGSFIIQIQSVNFTNDIDITLAGIYNFTAQESLSMQLATDEPIAIATPVAGVTATLASIISNGSDYESDTDFKRRWRDFVETRNNSAPYMENAIRQIEGVQDCNVYEVDSNPFDTLPLNCIYVVIKQGNFDYTEVLDTIFETKPPAIRSYFENTESTQQASYGRGNIRVGFDFAQVQKISNYTFNFYSKRTNGLIESQYVEPILRTIRFRIGESVIASVVNNYVMDAMPEWYASVNNNIGGNAVLAGQIRVIYEF